MEPLFLYDVKIHYISSGVTRVLEYASMERPIRTVGSARVHLSRLGIRAKVLKVELTPAGYVVRGEKYNI